MKSESCAVLFFVSNFTTGVIFYYLGNFKGFTDGSQLALDLFKMSLESLDKMAAVASNLSKAKQRCDGNHQAPACASKECWHL